MEVLAFTLAVLLYVLSTLVAVKAYVRTIEYPLGSGWLFLGSLVILCPVLNTIVAVLYSLDSLLFGELE